MTRRIDIQIIGSQALEEELTSASEGLDDLQFVLRTETELGRGVETVRDRAPEICVIDLEGSLESILGASEELTRTAAGTLLVGAYRPDSAQALERHDDWIGLMRSGLRDFLRRPVSSQELADVLERQVLGQTAQQATGRVACFAGNKGGVGKSTLAVNSSVLLANRHPGRVLLVDASMQLGSCAAMLDLEPQATIVDAARELYRLDETLLRSLAEEHESGLQLLAAPRDASESGLLDETSLGRILAVARRAYDWVVIDTFPLLDNLALTVLDFSDRVWVATSSGVPAVRGVASYLSLIERLGVPRERVRLVLNGVQRPFPGALNAGSLEERLGRPIDVQVPHSRRFLVSNDSGRVMVQGAPGWSRPKRAISRIAKDLESLPLRRAAAKQVPELSA